MSGARLKIIFHQHTGGYGCLQRAWLVGVLLRLDQHDFLAMYDDVGAQYNDPQKDNCETPTSTTHELALTVSYRRERSWSYPIGSDTPLGVSSHLCAQCTYRRVSAQALRPTASAMKR